MGSQSSQMSQMSQSNAGIGQTLYDDAASLGRFKALVILILGGIISIIMFFAGAHKLMFDNKNYIQTDARVMQVVDCMKTQTNKTWQYDCSINVEYTIDNKKYQKTIDITRGREVKVGDIINIYYNSSNKDDITSVMPYSGWLLIILSIFVLLSAYLLYWLSIHFKLFAAAEGTSIVASFFK
jgi:hypothetical protein